MVIIRDTQFNVIYIGISLTDGICYIKFLSLQTTKFF
jgi:hypothetical protein